jgi:hypothetical protein
MYLQIDVYMDYVVIEDQRVNRPYFVARSFWMRFWEGVSGARMQSEPPR